MIRSIHWFSALILCITIVPALPAGEQLSVQSAKLHPALSALAASHAAAFTGMPAFQAFGTQPSEIGVLVTTTDLAALRRAGVRVQSVVDHVATVRVRVNELEPLAALECVQWVEPGVVNTIQTDVSVPETGAPLLHAGFFNGVQYTGKGVIVLIYDTGIDFKHKDFRDPADTTKSRILMMWDQTLTKTGSEVTPTGFSYGVEYTKAQIEAELSASPAGFVREKDVNGHGSHVAGIAAGNGRSLGKYTGMAPEADIIVVKGGDGSFGEANMVDGLAYAQNMALKFGKPIVVNWSIGGQSGPHDGQRAYEAAVNNFVVPSGRVVSISAGNDGNAGIHRSGTLAPGAVDTIKATVPAYTPVAGSNNDYFTVDLWSRSTSAIDASAISPNGIRYDRASDTDGDGPIDSDGTITLYNHSTNANGVNRNVQLYVHDKSESAPKAGGWKLVVKNVSAANISYDVWLSSRSIGSTSVTLTGGDNNKTVSMPATAAGAITVGSYATKWSWPSLLGQYVFSEADRTGNISSFSSIGPTADGRQKPDIAAPGQGIVSVMSMFSSEVKDSSSVAPGGRHYLMQGTSMAAPHITGACALLLSANNSLTASGIKAMLQASANTDTYTASASSYVWGSGKLDVAEAMARLLTPGAVLSRSIIAYDSAGANVIYTLTGAIKAAVRLSVPNAGTLTEGIVNVTTSNNRPVVGAGNVICELHANNGGVPGALIGTSVVKPLQYLTAGTLNNISLSGAGMAVQEGQEYFLVFSLSNPADTLKLRTDQAKANIRSSVNTGSGWAATANNFRIRAELATTLGANDVAATNAVPLVCTLGQNYPNPFNPSTVISYTIPAKGMVTLRVFDILGREVADVIHAEETAGAHHAVWNGTTARGIPAAAGVYVYRLESAGMSLSHKMILLK